MTGPVPDYLWVMNRRGPASSGVLPAAGPNAGTAERPGHITLPPASPDDLARRRRRNLAVIAAVAAAALGVLLLQSLLYGHLSAHDEYDDGVYFASSLQLIHGALPYRDFVFIQPPMISVLLLPFAALSFLTGTAPALETARIFIDLVATANVVMVGLLVRHRPTWQVVVTVGFMAFYPATVGSAQTVLLEPPLVLFCLAGLLCLFDGDRITTSRGRLLACGALIGVGGAIKLWAALVFVAVVCVAWRSGPRARRLLVAGGAAGFLAGTAPFIIGSPAFFRQVFVTQGIRGGGGYPLVERVADLTGLPGLFSLVVTNRAAGIAGLAMVLVILVALGLAAFTGRGRAAVSPLEAFALLAAALAVAGLLGSPTYFYHYGGFAAPFVALVYGSIAVRLAARAAGSPAAALPPAEPGDAALPPAEPGNAALPPAKSGNAPLAPAQRRAARHIGVGGKRVPLRVAAATAVPLALIAAMAGLRVNGIVTAYPPMPVRGAFSSEIAARGCVLSLDPSLAILANRFTGDVPGCPQVIDWLGQERVLDHGLARAPSDTTNAAVQATFLRWVKASDTVIAPTAHRGWGPAVAGYMSANFRLEGPAAAGFLVYVRIPPRSG